jgi:hypothetical protein
VLGQERAGGHDRRLFPDDSVGGPCGLCVSFRRCVFKMCITRRSISLYLRHYRPGAALYLSLIYVEYIVNQQPRRGRWIESTEPRIILFLSALQKIHLIESKLSPVFCVYMYACSELIGPPIRKILPWQICYLVNFIVINLPRNSQVKKNCDKKYWEYDYGIIHVWLCFVFNVNFSRQKLFRTATQH